ncbi:MAG: aspartate-semialdehyde dehydrogenase [Candidatus Dadabacteria bacterium]|nr:MAG: aspartate-semialdehyde dehydrogenase [Candidatus Dadabacteria bacterium]
MAVVSTDEPSVAIIGATGLVGLEMGEILAERDFPFCDLRLYASERSVGEIIELGGEEYRVEELNEDSFEGVDIALFATDSELSSRFVPVAVEHGAVAIDNSSYFRLREDVPLVVPEINKDAIASENKIIANPNCSTVQLVMVLDCLRKMVPIKRVVVSTYQSVSGAGKMALDELWDQSVSIFNQREVEVKNFSMQIAFNCIPAIDAILDDGYTKEEMKVVNETRKILNLPDLAITATAVRVPVFHGHGESVSVETEAEVDIPKFIEILEEAPGIEVFPAYDIFPVQINAAGKDAVQVGRIRRDYSVEHGINMWIVADNLRKGAALNAVQIAECLIDA